MAISLKTAGHSIILALDQSGSAQRFPLYGAVVGFGLAMVSLPIATQAMTACLPGVYKPTHVVQPGDCYSSWTSFSAAMKAEGQQPVIVGNRKFGIYQTGDIFTADSQGRKGVNAELDVTYENKTSAKEIRIPTVYTNIKFNDVNSSSSLPVWGQPNIDDTRANNYCRSFNGACSSYNDYLQKNTSKDGGKKDSRIMMMAQSINSPTADGKWTTGQHVVIFRDMNNGYGDIAFLNSEGAITPSFGMQPVGYTQFARLLFVH